MIKIPHLFKRRRVYYVPLVHEDVITPEETLVDSASEYSDLEQPITDGIFRLATLMFAIAVIIIFVQVIRIGIFRHDYFAELAFKNKTVNFTVSPARGIIFDRQGIPLVENMPSFNVLIVSRELARDAQMRESQMSEVAGVLGIQEQIFLENIAVQSEKQAVFFVASNITKDQVFDLRRIGTQGVYVITNAKRLYISGPQFSSIIGYTGMVNENDLAADSYYLQSDSIGRQGIEAEYEESLRGNHGVIFFSRGSGGDVMQDPVSGNNVVLNIDADMQKALWNSLFNVLQEAGLSTAAAIVQDPRSGAVRALVSFPGYDNNLLAGSVSRDVYTRLFENELRPLFNRVIGGLYNPGSTIKPLIGMSALQEKILSPTDAIRDCVSITIPNPLNPDEPYVYKNWRVDLGLFAIRRAIANSCNVYFFIVGGGGGTVDGLGIRRIVQYLKEVFAGSVLGIDLPGEERGFIPTPEWKLKTRKENWYQGDTYNISIGQGDLLVTPLWINTYIVAIANNGVLYKPQVASKIIDGEKQQVEIFQPVILGNLPFEKDIIAEMRTAMREVVRSGTAKILQSLPVEAAAKTGTAEVKKGQSINSLFTVFAPFDSSEIVMTILIEGSSASNQSYVAQAAYRFLNWYFSQDRQMTTASPTLKESMSPETPASELSPSL